MTGSSLQRANYVGKDPPHSPTSTEKGWSLPGRSSQSIDKDLKAQSISALSSEVQELDSHIQR